MNGMPPVMFPASCGWLRTGVEEVAAFYKKRQRGAGSEKRTGTLEPAGREERVAEIEDYLPVRSA